jgi:hypothetical protein
MRTLSGPVKVGLLFGALGLFLTVLGILRGAVPIAPLNVTMALGIGFGVWFLVAWAVAQAARDVEDDLLQAELAVVESSSGEGSANGE